MTATRTRNYAAEMRKVIDAATGSGPYIPRQLASELVEKLRATDRDLLQGWLEAQAEHFLWQAINDIDRSRRSHISATRQRSAFADAAKEFEDDGRTAEKAAKLRDFLHMRFTVADGKRRELGSLKADDLMFVSNDYERRENDNAFWKVFMRTLAKKVGDDAVQDHFTNAQLNAMFASLG